MVNKSPQVGVALLEVLVSLIVIAVGLLGLAQLQTTSLKNNHAAYQRGQATLLATDIIERIRANAGALSSYSGTAPSSANPSCSSGCDGNALAQNDLYEWTAAIESILPASPAGVKPKGEIKGSGATRSVEISWYSVDKATVTFATEFQP